MELGALEVQIFVSLALVLGTIFAALICDFLKGNNEILRERNIELSVRQEERERLYAATVVTRVPQEVSAEPTHTEPKFEPHPAAKELPKPSKQQTWAKPEEIDELDRLAERIRGRIQRSDDKPELEEQQPAASVEQLAATVEEVEERVEQQVQQQAEGQGEEKVAEEPPEQPVEPAEETLVPPEQPQASEIPEPPPPAPAIKAEETVAEPPISASAPEPEPKPIAAEPELAPPKPSWSGKVTSIDALAFERASAAEARRLAEELERVANLATSPESPPTPEAEAEQPEPVDLRSLFDQEEHDSRQPVAEQRAEEPSAETPDLEVEPLPPSPPPVVKEAVGSRPALPAGIVDRETFEKLLESRQTFQGTVIAIGVAGLDEAPWEQNGTADLLKGLLRADDLACRTAENEFMLILPDQTGPESQQRIQHVSQQLWDHQIRSVGRSPVMFCWGATEAMNESLSTAVLGSRDRLEQTRRNRERAPRKIHNYRVVNS